MNKVNNSELVVHNFNIACKYLAEETNKWLFDGGRKWYWVADEVGGVCDFEDTDFLTPVDMVLILENKMTCEQYTEWRDYNIDAEHHINLSSWLKGCRPNMLKSKNQNTDDGTSITRRKL